MNKLQTRLQNKGNQKTMFVKYKSDNRIVKLKVVDAYDLVEIQSVATYCNRAAWKEYNGIVNVVQDVSTDEPIEATKERVKGAKNIRKANKKQSTKK